MSGNQDLDFSCKSVAKLSYILRAGNINNDKYWQNDVTFAILLTLTAGIAILTEEVSAQPNITMGNATGGNMSETNNSTGFIP